MNPFTQMWNWLFKALQDAKGCAHVHKGIYVDEVAATCEKTTTTCLSCRAVLDTKTECI